MTNVVHTPQSRCRAGVARCDITPPVSIYHRMWGAALHERATGVHRPLTATALFCGPFAPREEFVSRSETPTVARALAVTTIAITLIVLAFYLTRPQMDRNYGGGTCCLRWLIWLTPLWLLNLLPAADWLGKSRGGQAFAIALLAISVFSAHYAADNPWNHPWIYEWGQWLGWYPR